MSQVSLNVSGNVNLDVIHGVGMFEGRQMFDGKKIGTVLPAVVYHKKPLVIFFPLNSLIIRLTKEVTYIKVMLIIENSV